jgi:hypothetical protein
MADGKTLFDDSFMFVLVAIFHRGIMEWTSVEMCWCKEVMGLFV